MIVKEKVPPLKGVPDIRPEVFMVNPGGSSPEILKKETGVYPPEMLIWAV
ncbi:hypothetical protein JCM12294_45210 [Desulfocicer niacini]